MHLGLGRDTPTPDDKLMQKAELNALYDIDDNLQALGSSLKDFTTLPQTTSNSIIGPPQPDYGDHSLEQLTELAQGHIDQLNDDQRRIFNTIVESIDQSRSHKLFFIDGPDGTGKT
jgi:hypothetical protein